MPQPKVTIQPVIIKGVASLTFTMNLPLWGSRTVQYRSDRFGLTCALGSIRGVSELIMNDAWIFSVKLKSNFAEQNQHLRSEIVKIVCDHMGWDVNNVCFEYAFGRKKTISDEIRQQLANLAAGNFSHQA